ncbi:indolepyruvate ferredoxin oxidoreductase subunit alpha [bacterium]|nr:indolepyruvate ferredoxin oxidoreductase subunit alpha [bacterium]
MAIKRELMTGNEAVARGAWEAGVVVATSYPGTPSTEITEALSHYEEVNAEWSVNEKVALEVAIGAAFAGVRAIATMKHVGVNVAADPLFSLAYAGVNAGLVIVTADEPGLHSSQNEQDNRIYAKFAQIPMLEPSDAQEAKEMTKLAFELSEEHDTPVMLRLTTRICHTDSPVRLGRREEVPRRPYQKQPRKYAMLPPHAYGRHLVLEKRQAVLEAVSNTFDGNRVEMRSLEYGVVTSGISYLNVREALPEFSVLKIGMTYPVPHQLIRNFAQRVEYLYVVEENRPFLEEEIKALGIKVEGKEQLLSVGELPAEALRERIRHRPSPQKPPVQDLPPRPPQFCPGCGHRGVFHVLSKNRITVNGDIGCYSLGALAPFNAMDTLICMGASIGMDHGFRKAAEPNERSVSVIGDSTFFHSGMTNLLNMVYNNGTATTIILDNRITAMTGHQPNPASGVLAAGEQVRPANMVEICKALGVKHVRELDGFDMQGIEKALKEEMDRQEPSVLVINTRCVMVERERFGSARVVDEDLCTKCRLCLKLGCPALTIENDKIVVTDFLCDGCGLCEDVCRFDAIKCEEPQEVKT